MSAFVQKRTNGGAEMKLQFYIDSSLAGAQGERWRVAIEPE
jgi:hypothetical protein